MHFASFLSSGFITAIVVNLPERKPAKRTSVYCGFSAVCLAKKAKSVVIPILCIVVNTANLVYLLEISCCSFPVVSRRVSGRFSGSSIIDAPHSVYNLRQIFCYNCKGINKTRIRLHKYFGYNVSSSLCKCKLNRTQNRICAHCRILPVGP